MTAAPEAKRDLIPKRGERGFVVGQTGSGKTAFSCWLLERIDFAPIFIYDSKEEPKFDALTPNRVVYDIESMDKAYDDPTLDYIIVRPPLSVTSDPEALDALLYHHYENYSDSVAYIDELLQFHKNGRAGKGLQGLLTRGRSRGITTIMATQRPAWISLFAISEAQKFYLFFLSHEDDKKRLSKVIRDFDKLPDPPKHGFYFYEMGFGPPTKYGPIKLDKSQNVGYTDTDSVPEGLGDKAPRQGRIWI